MYMHAYIKSDWDPAEMRLNYSSVNRKIKKKEKAATAAVRKFRKPRPAFPGGWRQLHDPETLAGSVARVDDAAPAAGRRRADEEEQQDDGGGQEQRQRVELRLVVRLAAAQLPHDTTIDEALVGGGGGRRRRIEERGASWLLRWSGSGSGIPVS